MQHTQALADKPSFGDGVADTDLEALAAERARVWRGRVAMGALITVSVAGYALALAAIDAVVKGHVPFSL